MCVARSKFSNHCRRLIIVLNILYFMNYFEQAERFVIERISPAFSLWTRDTRRSAFAVACPPGCCPLSSKRTHSISHLSSSKLVRYIAHCLLFRYKLEFKILSIITNGKLLVILQPYCSYIVYFHFIVFLPNERPKTIIKLCANK